MKVSAQSDKHFPGDIGVVHLLEAAVGGDGHQITLPVLDNLPPFTVVGISYVSGGGSIVLSAACFSTFPVVVGDISAFCGRITGRYLLFLVK